MATASKPKADNAPILEADRGRAAQNVDEDRFLRYELGRLTERLDGLKHSTQSTNHLQIAAIVVVLVLSAFGAWGFNTQLAAANARIDRLDDKITSRLDRIDDHLRQMSDRVSKLDPGSAPSH